MNYDIALGVSLFVGAVTGCLLVIEWKRNQVNLDHLAQLAIEATPGNRTVRPENIGSAHLRHVIETDDRGGDRGDKHQVATSFYGRDAAFIAAANPSVVLALVDRIRSLEVIADLADDYVEARYLGARERLQTALAKLDNLGGAE